MLLVVFEDRWCLWNPPPTSKVGPLLSIVVMTSSFPTSHSFALPLSLPPARIISNLHMTELVYSSVCAPICGGFHPLTQRYSQNSYKNIHEQGVKITLNAVCRNMCQRHQSWFAEYLLARGRRTRVQRLVRTFQNISDHCNSALHVYIAPLKFSAYTLKYYCPIKTSIVSVQSSRNNPLWRQNIWISLREIQRSCKGHVIL